MVPAVVGLVVFALVAWAGRGLRAGPIGEGAIVNPRANRLAGFDASTLGGHADADSGPTGYTGSSWTGVHGTPFRPDDIASSAGTAPAAGATLDTSSPGAYLNTDAYGPFTR